MSESTKTPELNDKKYTLTKYELYRAKQMYRSIPRAEKTTNDWEWAVETALQETKMKDKEKRANKIEPETY
jgi:hypothetical protein